MTGALATHPLSSPVEKIDGNKPAQNPVDLRRFLEGNMGVLRRVAASIDAGRAVGIVCAAASRNPRLAECTPISILRVLQQGAELGLEVAGGLQEFHPVPYWNSTLRCFEAQGIPGFQGLTKLVMQTGTVARVTCEPVYKGDSFDYQLGDGPFLRHKPDLAQLGEDRPDAEILAFYAVAFFKDGSTQFEVMGRGAMDKLMARALERKKGQSPWHTDYSEMGRKTVLRRLCKRLPKTAALARALDLQASAEKGEFLAGELIHTHVVEVPTPSLGAGAAPPTPVTDAALVAAGEAAPGSPQASDPAPAATDGPDFEYGETLSKAQINTAKGHADRLKLDHTASRRVLCVVSHGDKAAARSWMDMLFSKDDAKIRFAYENHPAWVASAAGPLPGAAVPSASNGPDGPSDDIGWPEER